MNETGRLFHTYTHFEAVALGYSRLLLKQIPGFGQGAIQIVEDVAGLQIISVRRISSLAVFTIERVIEFLALKDIGLSAVGRFLHLGVAVRIGAEPNPRPPHILLNIRFIGMIVFNRPGCSQHMGGSVPFIQPGADNIARRVVFIGDFMIVRVILGRLLP